LRDFFNLSPDAPLGSEITIVFWGVFLVLGEMLPVNFIELLLAII
jgi:hypothetical protein